MNASKIKRKANNNRSNKKMANYKFKDKDSKRRIVLKTIRHPSKPINQEKMMEVYGK